MKRAPVIIFALYTLLAIIFYYFETGLEIVAFFRGLGISGFTFIAISLLITPLAMFIRQLTRFVAYRTEAGVFGTMLVVMHIIILLLVSVHEDLLILVAGSIAILIYLAMIATTGAKKIHVIGFSKWKMIHRLVYIAFPLAAAHAVINYPEALTEPFGLIMIILVVSAVVFQIAGFVKRITKKN